MQPSKFWLATFVITLALSTQTIVDPDGFGIRFATRLEHLEEER